MTAVLFELPCDRASWESVEQQTVKLYVQSGDRILEGGLGSGTITQVLLNAGATVDAYEPQATELEHLWPWLLVKLPSALSVTRAALAAWEGTTALPTGKAWWETGIDSANGMGRVVRVVNALHELDRLKPDGLVLDIEGAEHGILRGLGGFIPRWIVAELHPPVEAIDVTIAALKELYSTVTVHYRKVNAVVGCR